MSIKWSAACPQWLLVISFKCWGRSLSRPPADPLGKDLIATMIFYRWTVRDELTSLTVTRSVCSQSDEVSDWDGCLACKACALCRMLPNWLVRDDRHLQPIVLHHEHHRPQFSQTRRARNYCESTFCENFCFRLLLFADWASTENEEGKSVIFLLTLVARLLSSFLTITTVWYFQPTFDKE